MSTTAPQKGSKGSVRAKSKARPSKKSSKAKNRSKRADSSKKGATSTNSRYNNADSQIVSTTAVPDGYVEVPYNASYPATTAPPTYATGYPVATTGQYPSSGNLNTVGHNKNSYTKTIIITVGIVILLIVIIIVACCIAKKNDTFNDFNNEALIRHNYYRQLHHTSPLTLDSDLVAAAQKWADHMASTLSDDPEPNQIYGENVAKLKPELNRIPNGNDITEIFYTAHDKYNYDQISEKCCTQFTQLIWRSTKTMGCGFNVSLGPLYVSCKYFPPGNIMGQFPANVKKDY